MRSSVIPPWGLRTFIALIALLLAWLFVGIDLYAGDHETGSNWVAFLKHRPDLRLKFVNPSLRGLEFAPFDALDPAIPRLATPPCARPASRACQH